MLVDNKFIYISLPRCGSTSFHYSCILSELSVKNLTDVWEISNSKVDFKNVNELDIMNSIEHGHEQLIDLKQKFGSNLPIIAVNRDRHDTFYSLYKHVVYDFKRTGWLELSNWFANVVLDELFFFNTTDLMNKQTRWDIINSLLIKKGFIKKYVKIPTNYDLKIEEESYIINILEILITPKSIWHNHDTNIIWFNINEMDKMEKWVRDITNKDFKLKHVNSSSYIETKLVLDDEFKHKYNSIYDYFDLPKEKKTLI